MLNFRNISIKLDLSMILCYQFETAEVYEDTFGIYQATPPMVQ